MTSPDAQGSHRELVAVHVTRAIHRLKEER